MILILLLYGLISITFVFSKYLVINSDPIFLTTIRMILSSFFLLLIILIFKIEMKIKSKKDLIILIANSIFSYSIPFYFEYISLKFISAPIVCLFYNLSPFFTALFSYFYFNEKITKKKVLGLIIGFIGILFITDLYSIFKNLNILEIRGVFSNLYLYLFLIFMVISSSFGWIQTRILIQKDYNPFFINFISTLFSSITFLPLLKNSLNISINNPIKWIGLLILIIFITNIFFYNLYSYLLKKYTATFLSFCGFLTPLFTLFFDKLFFKQAIGSDFFLAMIIISFGLFLFHEDELL